jgi:acetamidase/formamidase
MRVRSKLRVSLFDSAHMPAPLSTTGEAEFFFTSTSANTLNFDRLYQKAMKTALFKAMESLSGALNSPAHP